MDQESLHEISYQNQENQIGQQWRKQNAPSKKIDKIWEQNLDSLLQGLHNKIEW